MGRTIKFFVLFLALALIAVGCSELPPTGPAGVNEELSKPANQQIVKLDYKVEDPVSGFSEVVGELSCYHEVLTKPSDNNSIYLVRVQLELEAELQDMLGMYHLKWGISGKSDDLVQIKGGSSYILKKIYPITNRNDCVLAVDYVVTTEGVGISDMWLEPID